MRFNMNGKCDACQGTGMVESIIFEEDIMLVIHHNMVDGSLQKIDAIKQVRQEYGISLREAKELVEGAATYYNVIKKFATHIPSPTSAQKEYDDHKKDCDCDDI